MNLSGEQYGTFIKDVYNIGDDLIIEENKTLTFEKGSILIFSEYTGCLVKGKLICNGTIDAPVIFKSKKGLQWNGVTVTPDGRVEFEQVKIQSSIKGVIVADSTSLDKFSEIIFKDNESSLTIGSEEISVKDKEPITIKKSVPLVNTIINYTDGPNQSTKRSPALLIARYVLASASITSALIWGCYHHSSEHYYTKYQYDQTGSAGEFRIKSDDHKKISKAGKVATFITVPIMLFSITIDENTFRRRRK